jgi:hypothetical protein
MAQSRITNEEEKKPRKEGKQLRKGVKSEKERAVRWKRHQ